MKKYRILQIDDEPLMLKLVSATLGRDPSLVVTTCSAGDEGVALADKLLPDLILCDVFMPGMSGTQALLTLRENPRTAHIPLIFTTARAHKTNVNELKSLGAAAVIAKPFQLNELAGIIHHHLGDVETIIDEMPLVPVDYDFAERLSADAATLKDCRARLAAEPGSPGVPEQLRSCVHKLAGAAAIYEFPAVSEAASAVEDALEQASAGRAAPDDVFKALDALLERMA